MTVDLHTHTTASDGTFTPTELVQRAYDNKVKALAITDHDTVMGLKEAQDKANQLGIEFIKGIEFSTTLDEKEIHMVGLFIDPDYPTFADELKDMQNFREIRNDKMLKRLEELGYLISSKELEACASGEIITRAHFARVLVEKGYYKSMNAVFEKILGCGCPGYVKRKTFTPTDAIGLIKDSGGLAIMAHPLLYGFTTKELRAIIGDLKEKGLDGLETYYASFSQQEMDDLKSLCKEYDLLLSGGSDFHGDNRKGVDVGKGYGNLHIPYKIVEAMKTKITSTK